MDALWSIVTGTSSPVVVVLLAAVAALVSGRVLSNAQAQKLLAMSAESCAKELAARDARLADRDEQLEAIRKDRDEWKGMALTLLGHSQKAIDLVSATAEKGAP